MLDRLILTDSNKVFDRWEPRFNKVCPDSDEKDQLNKAVITLILMTLPRKLEINGI